MARMGIVPLVVIFLVATAWLSPAQAHRLKVFATVVGTSIQGKAYFVGSGPAQNISATLRDSSEKVVAHGRTDTEGRFALNAPVRADLTVMVDALDGHVARFEIAASRLPDTLPPSTGETVTAASQPADQETAAIPPPATQTALLDPALIGAEIARQIEPLAEQLDSLESSIRLHDVLGGLGYIVGIFGLVAFLKSRRTSSSSEGSRNER